MDFCVWFISPILANFFISLIMFNILEKRTYLLSKLDIAFMKFSLLCYIHLFFILKIYQFWHLWYLREFVDFLSFSVTYFHYLFFCVYYYIFHTLNIFYLLYIALDIASIKFDLNFLCRSTSQVKNENHTQKFLKIWIRFLNFEEIRGDINLTISIILYS